MTEYEDQKNIENLRLAAIVESSNDAIIGKTLDGIIISWNKAAQIIYGFTAEEVIGRSISILMPSEREDEMTQILEKIRAGEQIKHFETARKRKDGQLIFMSLTISPIKDEGGRILGASTIGRDISVQKRTADALRASEQRLRTIVENSMDAIFLTSPDGTIFSANPWACRMFGMTEQEICNGGREGIVERDLLLQKSLEERSRNGKYRGEITCKRKDGTRFPAEGSSSVFTDNEGRERTVIILRDITERKRMQKDLADKVAQLEAALAQVKQLEGIIPISMYCKRIRSDKEGWQQLERYIAEHSEAEFSHGICPECYEKAMKEI